MSESAIDVKNLVKYFGGRCVLKGIDLKIPQGCIYGLLGRNGVGKTTLIRILLGLEHPTRGSTTLLGQDSLALTSAVKGRTAYVAEGHNLIQGYRVKRLIQICRSLSHQWNENLFNHLVEQFHLPMDRKVKALSAGMRAQLNLALALATNPELLILDDPTLGLDTVARRQFLELAIELIQQDGRTILFSSHILSDVERIADRIGILVAGQLVVDCSLEQLKHRVKKLRLIFPETAPSDIHLTDVIRSQVQGREVILTVANWNEQKQAMIGALGPLECAEQPMSLEDIFLECTGAWPVIASTEDKEIDHEIHIDPHQTRD
jgi:ABC-2 type transport system ATP-binding protein